MAEKERIRHFDTLKGIAIILVVVHHVFGYNDTIIDQMLESLRMPLFVLVSGIFFHSDADFGCWLLRNSIATYFHCSFSAYYMPLFTTFS